MHPGLEWLRRLPEGRVWLGRLPQILEECRERWALELEEPYAYAFASLVIPAGDLVLKIQFPDRESEHEADALRLWAGDGAVLLHDYDVDRRALLLERLRPGTSLKALEGDGSLDVITALLPRLWKPAAEGFRPLAEEAAWWLEDLEAKWVRGGRPFERRLLDAGLEALRDLPPTQGPAVVLHQDLHADNVLAGEREPWLVIDPKPLVGEREFGLAPVIRGAELGHDERSVRHRLDRLTSELELDRERTRCWTIGQTLAWAWDDHDRPHQGHVEVARWLLQAR